MNTKLEIERWERHWRIFRLNGLDGYADKFNFPGKSVLELGCGPVLGCGPMAIFRGAERFWYKEPDLVRTALESSQVKARYFDPLFDELVANYGKLANFDEWYSKVIELSSPLPDDAGALVDITVSHSVLEHIPRFELLGLLSDLNTSAKPGSWFTHTIDFGPHGGLLQEVDCW